MRAAAFFEPDPSGMVLGPSLAGKRSEIGQNQNCDLSFLLWPLLSQCHDDRADRQLAGVPEGALLGSVSIRAVFVGPPRSWSLTAAPFPAFA